MPCSLINRNTGLLKIIVGVLTTYHTQYTWDSSTCIFLFNRTTLQVFVTYLTGALYVHPLWFYKHQHDNRVRSAQNAFSLPFAAILVNCAPSGEMHNYCTPHIIKETLRISWSFGATTYSYLKCIVYDKLLKPWQSFSIILYIFEEPAATIFRVEVHLLHCWWQHVPAKLVYQIIQCHIAEDHSLNMNCYRILKYAVNQ
jgi:hypothetical protein